MKIFPIFIPHFGCPGECIYCNQRAITGVSSINFSDLKLQIKKFCEFNTQVDKQIAFFGGSFSNLSISLQTKLLEMVPIDAKTSIRFSTRPDCINEMLLAWYKEKGVNTIELGIQSFDDNVLNKSKRFYRSEEAKKTCYLVKEAGFELGIQLMPGLPESSKKTIDGAAKTTIQIKPCFVRIYPTVVLVNTELADLFHRNEFAPLSLDSAVNICAEMKTKFEENNIHVIKIGLHSDIKSSEIITGPYHQSFGELVKSQILVNKITQQWQKDKILNIANKDISLLKGNKGLF